MHERGPTEVFSGDGSVAEPGPLKIEATWTGKGRSVVEVCLHVHEVCEVNG